MRPLLIGIDASRATLQQRTGTEGYSLQVIREMIALDSPHRFRLYVRGTPPEGLFPDHPRVEICLVKRPRLWTHLALGPEVRQSDLDVLFVPAHVIPWPNTGSIPSVVTIHDLGYMHYPDTHRFMDRMYLSWSTQHSASVASRVIVVSKATAHDLVSLHNIQSDKVRVVYSGVDELLRPQADQQHLESVRELLGTTRPYILHVGSIQPRKNLSRLIEAFAIVHQDHPDLALVLAGKQAWKARGIFQRIQTLSLKDDVILPGYVPDKHLAALYSSASVYAFPSLYEGFGFPAIEAMACGTPVVCSNSSSLPELVGDAALTVAPTDVQGLAKAINRVLSDAGLRDGLIQRGLARVEQFTWQRAAAQTLDVLIEAATC
ncbi:MAG: glycosyltransferase family 4 protein [Chloroflexi bacterium]|nr:glycosyltransferase family 4 protein [Chloroflexota bacterium]